tara:strand:+ start:3323 stop:3571 length:249 start_codon:yes stop_codon:yes gene_type:complete
MITLAASNNMTTSKKWEDLKTSEKIANVFVFLMIIGLVIWAWCRAYKCSSKSPDSRAIHYLFASVDPVLYLVFSYFIDGMCP